MKFYLHIAILADLVFIRVVFRQSHCCDFMGAASVPSLEDAASQQTS